MAQKFDISDPKIQIRNGNVLPCLLLASNANNTIAPRYEVRQWRDTEKTFMENVFLFLANADTIFSDSRMFLAQANVHNGMAYSGAFEQACLGAYLEWWIYGHEFSIDKNGRPIWFLSGSPLSGCHACGTVDENGQYHRADLQHTFGSTCHSFGSACKDYRDAQQHCQAFSIDEVVEILKGKDSIASRARIHAMMEYFKMDNEIQSLKLLVENWKKEFERVTDRVRHLLFEKHHAELEEYYKKSLNLETIAKLKREHYRQQRVESRKALKAETITPHQHQNYITPLRKDAENAEWEWRQFSRDRLAEILADDRQMMTPYDVEKLFLEQGSQHRNDTENQG